MFLLAFGLLVPLAVVLPFVFYFQGMGAPFWLMVAIALGLAIFTVQRLIVGPTWYR